MAAEKAETGSMTPTPDDPGAIDLERASRIAAGIKKLAGVPGDGGDAEIIYDLIAAVKALREEIAGYNTLFDLAAERERPWIEAWQEATGGHNRLPDYGKILAWICDRAEAAEAREAVLAGALDEFREHVLKYAVVWEAEGSDHHHPIWEKVTAALATTRPQVLKRGRAVEAVVKASDSVIDTGQRLRSDPGSHELALAVLCNVMGQLAKLDALGKEGKK